MNSLFSRLAFCVLAVSSSLAGAEDIDLFTGAQSPSASRPNVLILVDNTANWNQAFTNEMAALTSTFQNIPVNDDGTARFNLGVLFAAETSSTDNNIGGGYVRAAIRPMTRSVASKYATMISSLDKLNDKGNGGASSLVMAEAFRYFSSGAPIAGNYKAKTDYTGNTGSDWSPSVTSPASLSAMKAIYALPGNALTSKGGTPYNALPGTGCSKNYIIYISNGAASDNSSFLTQATQYLQQAGGNTTQLPLSPAGSAANVSDEWARFMKSHPVGVTTYTIDVDPKSSGQGPGWTKLLQSMSTVSDGKYIAVDSTQSGGAQISAAVNAALSEIQSVNTVFASVSLPVSVNTQGTFLNQVYIGMFRPDAAAAPRWSGNLKQYRMGLNATTLRLEDATGAGAINNLTGFITECARSYWTPASADTYWSFKPAGVCAPPANQSQNFYQVSNSPDGSVVEKGGQGYVLRAQTTRNLKTCSTNFGSCTALTPFASTDVTNAGLGVASSADRTSLLNWAYGLDVDDENLNGVTTELRPSVHGDVVHSRPVALNVGTAVAPNVVVFYGGNDGVFRAINGNRPGAGSDIGTVPAGGELWSFMPPEFFGSLKRLRANSPQIKFPNITASDAKPKDYGLDGSVTAYQAGVNNWVFTTMRRGGRVIYSFNIDKTNPANVTLRWKRGCPSTFASNGSVSDTNCSTGFSDIGQTWSSPQVVRTSNYPTVAGRKPLLMFGGGYDPCEDADPKTCGASSKGKRVYVLDAETGDIQKTFTTDAAVMADIAIAPDQVTGFAQYAYVVDLAGNVYRISILDQQPSSWTMTKIASLGCDSLTACSGVRKFMFAPDITQTGTVYSLLVGSGDREKPQLYNGGSSTTNSVRNYFFKIDDSPTDAAWLTGETTNCGSAVICLSSLTPILTNANPTEANLTGKKGWYLGLTATQQVVTSAITIFGNVTFSTHQPNPPDATSCTNDLGVTRVYNVQLTNAAPQDTLTTRFEVLPPVGLPPSPVAGMVTLEDGKTVAFCIGCSSISPLEAKEPPIPLALTPRIPKSRVYWYVED